MSDLGGTTTHPMDKKGRVSLPTRHYKVLLDDLVFFRGLDRKFPCLWVYKASEFNEWARNLLEGEEGFQPRSASQNALKRRLFGGREDVKVDSAQRMLIPKALRDYASLEDSVVILGVDDHLEIYNPDILEESTEFYSDHEIFDRP
jgi:MraZ protein